MVGMHPLHDTAQRPLHIIVIGAGPSGIATLIALKKLSNITFQCFEKNPEVGGTWFETRYPGAACDIASHAYQYTFEPKKDWSRHFAPAEEIGGYFISVARKHGLHELIDFSSPVVGARWDEDASIWRVRIKHAERVTSGPATEESEYTCDILINAGGILNNWQWPEIEGLEQFKGELVHTASWKKSINLADKRVAVIGSGASGIQVLPSIQPSCRSVDLYVRSPTYILPTVGVGVESSTYNQTYTPSDIERFSSDDQYYLTFRKVIEQQMNEHFANSIKNSQEQKDGRLWAENMMRQIIVDPKLQEKLIPNWEFGCRRVTPGLPYLKAVQEPNVNVIRENIVKITKVGIKTEDGDEHPVDTIVCATGFNTSFLRFEIVGRKSRTLAELWQERGPEAYLGTAIAGLPNYFTILGPNCPIANGSLIPCIEASIDYIIQFITKVQKDQIKTFAVKKSVQDAFNDYTQEAHQQFVWSGSCNSWYKDRVTGRVTAVWPGSSIHFMETIATPRYEDFELEYVHKNLFKFMGNGFSQREANNEDLTYYLGPTPKPNEVEKMATKLQLTEIAALEKPKTTIVLT